jgi:hypothetical protein
MLPRALRQPSLRTIPRLARLAPGHLPVVFSSPALHAAPRGVFRPRRTTGGRHALGGVAASHGRRVAPRDPPPVRSLRCGPCSAAALGPGNVRTGTGHEPALRACNHGVDLFHPLAAADLCVRLCLVRGFASHGRAIGDAQRARAHTGKLEGKWLVEHDECDTTQRKRGRGRCGLPRCHVRRAGAGDDPFKFFFFFFLSFFFYFCSGGRPPCVCHAGDAALHPDSCGRVVLLGPLRGRTRARCEARAVER